MTGRQTQGWETERVMEDNEAKSNKTRLTLPFHLRAKPEHTVHWHFWISWEWKASFSSLDLQNVVYFQPFRYLPPSHCSFTYFCWEVTQQNEVVLPWSRTLLHIKPFIYNRWTFNTFNHSLQRPLHLFGPKMKPNLLSNFTVAHKSTFVPVNHSSS